MLCPKKLKEIFRYIEKKRDTKSIFWQICVLSKDIVWALYYYGFDSFFRLFRTRQYFKEYKRVETFYKVSFCTTSMDRLHHIKKTLIKNIKNNISYPNVEFVLLDYNSKDDLKTWVEQNCSEYINKGILKYHRVEWPSTFHMANAKNISHSLATGDIVCGLDADNFTNKNFAFYINFEFNKDKNIIGHCSGKMSDFGGRMFLSKENFHALNGYDENFIGWGFEDLDFKHRAFDLGLNPISISNFFLNCIKHGDHMRHKNMPISKEESLKRNEELFLKKRQEGVLCGTALQ